ncbi:hypothetical protein [Thermogemmatispora tikiterensis]|uniref:Uncharacterized protein n=1 Tax=Thermogemmatispora tikiterensis TaxID=1825093 RepID=A0A328VNG6_9CHLR|nr:hypothetical protein [Thermogemmatispora tikiterensis]RAQ98401.1 hypothetical protein A4R35_22865 [Thermogemmatispora tikiterensis]
MKAASYYDRGDVRIEEVPEPGTPGEGEVLLQVLRAGICGTDVAEFLRQRPLAQARGLPAASSARASGLVDGSPLPRRTGQHCGWVDPPVPRRVR